MPEMCAAAECLTSVCVSFLPARYAALFLYKQRGSAMTIVQHKRVLNILKKYSFESNHKKC